MDFANRNILYCQFICTCIYFFCIAYLFIFAFTYYSLSLLIYFQIPL